MHTYTQVAHTGDEAHRELGVVRGGVGVGGGSAGGGCTSTQGEWREDLEQQSHIYPSLPALQLRLR